MVPDDVDNELAMVQRPFSDHTFLNSTIAMAIDTTRSAQEIDDKEDVADTDLSAQTLLPSLDGDMEEAQVTTEPNSAPEQLIDSGGDSSTTSHNYKDNVDDKGMVDNSGLTMQQLPILDDNIEEADVPPEVNSAPDHAENLVGLSERDSKIVLDALALVKKQPALFSFAAIRPDNVSVAPSKTPLNDLDENDDPSSRSQATPNKGQARPTLTPHTTPRVVGSSDQVPSIESPFNRSATNQTQSDQIPSGQAVSDQAVSSDQAVVDHVSSSRETTPGDPSEPTADVCHFLNLPGELRNRIYRFSIVKEGNTEVDKARWTTHQPALLKTCPQIRSEALPIFYVENKITCNVHNWNPIVKERMFALYAAHNLNSSKLCHWFSGVPDWGNLLAWLQAVFQGTSGGGLSDTKGKVRALERKTIGVMFLIARRARGAIMWSTAQDVLESHRELLVMGDHRWSL